MENIFIEPLRKILLDQCTADTVRTIEAGGSAKELWQVIDASGFVDAMLPEESGGAGLELGSIYPMLELFGASALPVPLAETMIARALINANHVAPPVGSICLLEQGGCLAAPWTRLVPSGRVADYALTCDDVGLLLLPLTGTRGDAIFPLDSNVTWTQQQLADAQRVGDKCDLLTLRACICAAQLAGAMLTIFSRTLQFANDRIQFDRPIGKFQAIQHQLSVMAEQVFAARMAAQLGCRGNPRTLGRSFVAMAKARTSEAALEVASLAHSIHGAIGFTAEFDLQLFTRRLHLWRQAAGSESYWHDFLGNELVIGNGKALEMVQFLADT